MTRIAKLALFCSVASVWPLAAQTPAFDTSGNARLNGTYYFRHVLYVVNTSADSTGVVGDVSEAIALYGNIAFDGNGHYAISNGIVSDSNVGQTDPLSCYQAQAICAANAGAAVSGTYSISASGFGFLSNPIASGDFIYGLVAANGLFSGSSTETTYAYNDLFIAAPIPSPLPTNSSFNGSYTVAGFLPGEDMFFQMNPNGAGSLGTVNVTGYYKGGGATTASQSSTATYAFSNGAAVVTFPTSTTANFFSGPEYLYFSPDGAFFFGGSPTDGYDMIVGINNNSATGNFGGLYYQAGIDQSFSDLNAGYADLDGYYGSFNATSSGNIVAHERLDDQIFVGGVYGWTFSDSFTPGVTGTYTDTSQSFQYAVGGGGKIRIGQGIGPYLGLSVAFQAPTFTPSGPVYINPTGIVNSASSAPFTAGVSNGEFLTIYSGTNLAPPGLVVSSSLATQVNGVQVLVNGTPAQIYYVSPTQISFIAPYSNTSALAQFQVINNGTQSNVVTELVNPTTPGVFIDGQGYAAALHNADYSLVSPSNPAQPCPNTSNPVGCDYIDVYLSGLGALTVNPPSTTYYTTNTIAADIDGASAPVVFAGLTTDAGLYQVSLLVPSTITAGDHLLDISGLTPTASASLESYAQQVLISVGGGSAARTTGETPRSRRPRVDSSLRQRPRPCLFGAKPACTVEK